MWLWNLIGLSIITKVHGYADGASLQSCESISPVHTRDGSPVPPQTSDLPFEVSYNAGKVGEPITVYLRSKQPTEFFRGFLLEAREKGKVDTGPPVGKFILLNSATTKLLSCSDLANSAVTQVNNGRKTSIQVNWTAPGEMLDITFRASFVQSYYIFWDKVDAILPGVTTPPPLPPSTTTITEPSTTTSTTEPSTTTITTEPSSTTTTTEPSTTTITEPSSTTITEPSSTTSTTEPSTTTRITEPSTTTITTEPSTTSTIFTTTQNSTPHEFLSFKLKRAATVLLNIDNMIVAVKLELPNILTITLTNRVFLHRLNKVVKISCSLLCAAAEISSLILLCVGDSFKVIFALVCVVVAINFIELIIISLPVGPSHELKEICDLAVKVCSVIHMIFTTAAVFIGVLEIDNCSQNRTESWLLKVMAAYTAWIFLFVIWVFIFSTHRKTILQRSKIGSSRNSESQQRKKKRLSAAEMIVTAVSVTLVIGNMCFTAAVIAGIFGCQEK